MRYLVNETLPRLSLMGLLLALSLSASAADETRVPQAISVTIPYRCDWIELPPTPSMTDDVSTTHAAVRFLRVAEPGSDPSQDVEWPYTCGPEHVRHEFRLEKRESLLGEPILIEYRVSVEGQGEWEEWIGGNYRSRDRDDNFLFLMRHEDGAWVAPGQPYSALPGGGMMGPRTVSKAEPLSLFFAAQRWCAIERPGRYDLYCIYQAPGPHDVATTAETFRAQIPEEVLRTHTVNEHGRLYKADSGEISSEYYLVTHRKEAEFVPSPLLAHMPGDLKAFLKDPALPPTLTYTREYVNDEISRHLGNATAFAHISIAIVPGTPDQQHEMVAAWTQRGAQAVAKVRSDPSPEETAVLEGMYYSRQSCFLPAIREWIQKDNALLWGSGLDAGVQLNPSPDAIAMLLEFPRGDSIDLGSVPCHDTNPHVMPALIELLSHEDAGIRSRALHVLRRNAGGYFFADPEGGPLEQLSDAQLSQARKLWQAWWERNKADVHCFRRGVWGYIDARGEFVISPQFTRAWPFRGGSAEVNLGACTPMDQSLRFAIDRQGVRQSQQAIRDSEDTALRPVRMGTMWGYEAQNGEVRIPPRFEWAGSFSQSLAPVKVDGKSGYIDERGELAIAPTFDSTHGFEDGRAVVQVDGLYGIIGLNGEFLVQPQYAYLSVFKDGRALFKAADRYGYIDESGHIVIAPQFQSADDFSEGLARVQLPRQQSDGEKSSSEFNLYGFINRAGELIIPPAYIEAKPFAEGLAAVRVRVEKRLLWGYIDQKGEMVVSPQFDDARSFCEGRAVAGESGKERFTYGYIDPSGNTIIPPHFPSAHDFSEGLAAVCVESPYFHFDADVY